MFQIFEYILLYLQVFRVFASGQEPALRAFAGLVAPGAAAAELAVRCPSAEVLSPQLEWEELHQNATVASSATLTSSVRRYRKHSKFRLLMCWLLYFGFEFFPPISRPLYTPVVSIRVLHALRDWLGHRSSSGRSCTKMPPSSPVRRCSV